APGSAAQTTRLASIGARKPRRSSVPAGSSSMRPPTRRAAPGPTRISPGALLQPRGEVDGFAGGEGRRGVVGDDLARLDADAGLEAELANPLERGERRADGALGVVLVREGHAEGGHD